MFVNGKEVLDAFPPHEEQRAASESAIFVLTDMLRSAIEHGTGRSVRTNGFTRPAAGKTGTSNESRDAWFAGFTPHLLTIVWVGFDDNEKLGLTGGQASAPIWANYMKCLGDMEPNLDFIAPPGVVMKTIDRRNGLLATEFCDARDITREIFVEGTEPITESSCDGSFDSGLPTTAEPVDEGIVGAPPRDSGQPQRGRSLWDSIFNNR
jgi:membrane carboxypeptidase/penicillin-binding protein